jgi:heme-degrading monooxygenase HmoA
MIVKVIIARQIQEGRTKAVFNLLNELRSLAMNQAGYFSGETLISHEDPHKLVVISTWLSEENWLKWKERPERKAIEANMQRLLTGPTQYDLYVCGSYPPKE